MDFNPDLLALLLAQDLGNPVGEVRAFKAEALKKSLLKKYVPPGKKAEFHTAALASFCALNDKVKDFVIADSFLTSRLFLEWKRIINDAIYSGPLQSSRITLAGAFANGHCGPGASLGADNCTFFWKMFNSHITTTSPFLYEHYLRSLSPRWSLAESYRQQDFSVKVVPGSKLASVPKDRTKNRTTCTEPILNMFYQLGVKDQIESILKSKFNIDLATQQDINRALARIGSISGALATEDLKDASDSISVVLCQHLLPPAIMRLLQYIRSPRTHVGKELVELHMISTMGNGFTFALMTMLFAALVKAIYNLSDVKAENGINYGVFGDDIIIATEHVETLNTALSSAGFTVNESKSYTTGPFRESCGGDFYSGHDVRGVYIKEFTHETHCYSAFNRLHFWSVKHNYPLCKTLRYLKTLVEFRPVPYDVGVDAGFIVTRGELTSPKFDSNGAIYYHALQNQPTVIRDCSDKFMNHHGGLISFLGGYVRNNKMALRPKDLNYIVVKGVTPLWDNISDPLVLPRDLSLSWTDILMSDPA
jgi:hypothetical protein